jgi:hypothetical protein
MFQTWSSPASLTKAGADADSGKPVNLSFRHTNDNAAYSSALKCRYLSGDPKVRSATIAVANPFPPETVSPVAPPDQRAGIGIGGVHGRGTVGFTMSRGAQLIATGKLSKPGILTPLDVAYDDVLPALERHGIRVKITRE